MAILANLVMISATVGVLVSFIRIGVQTNTYLSTKVSHHSSCSLTSPPSFFYIFLLLEKYSSDLLHVLHASPPPTTTTTTRTHAYRRTSRLLPSCLVCLRQMHHPYSSGRAAATAARPPLPTIPSQRLHHLKPLQHQQAARAFRVHQAPCARMTMTVATVMTV